jgi:hypothetical protein
MEMLMKKIRLCMFVAALLVLALTSSTYAQQNNLKTGQSLQPASAGKGKSSLEETIISMEKRAWEAVKARDTKAFSDLFAADGLMADSMGFSTREGFFKTLPDLTINEYTLSDLKVMMIDKDSALITYKAEVKGSFKGQAFPPNPAYVSSIWTKRNGKWIAIYHQETVGQ